MFFATPRLFNRLLGAEAKQSPGWLSNVNWSADWDSGNGWNPGTTKTTTASVDATYTPDKEIPVVSGGIAGGDPDLRKFVVKVTAQDITGNHDWDFRLTFPSSVRVYKDTNTKEDSPVESGTVFRPTDGNHITKTKAFFLEGLEASAAFRDVQLRVEYVGGNITMLTTVDIVNITVIGVTQQAFMNGPQHADNKFRFSNITVNGQSRKASRDENGIISWDTGMYPTWSMNPPQGEGIDYCQYFANCMEMQGTVQPPRDVRDSVYYGFADDPSDPQPPPLVLNQPLVKFIQDREAYGVGYAKKGNNPWTIVMAPHLEAYKWKPDNNLTAQHNIPTMSSHIYYSDSPIYIQKTDNQLDYYQYILSYRNRVSVEIYGSTLMCSDWAKWYSQMCLKPKPNQPGFLTRANSQYQILADEWYTIPTQHPHPLDIANW